MKTRVSALALALLTSIPAQAAMLAVETGVMDWGSKAENHFGDGKSENEFITLKGATGNAFGDVYGHVKLEDFTDSEMIGSEINLVGQINIGDSDWNWYGQVFNKQKPVWSETNTTLGLSHDKTWDNGLYTQVALAGHIVTSDYAHFRKANGEPFDANGFNGGYLWLCATQDLELAGHHFSLGWWQEHFFGRGDDYLMVSGDGEDHGFNGQLTLRYHIGAGLSASLQYRYAENNLGKKGYHDGLFYALQYNF
ncbi:outer membrane protein OmpK [Ferrimonas futtsuensis]|uniref:outer membrane protein OmpK n=1 Tax=Ferrimonas futtsuensis TaxID=364764 RepID=UPI0004221033|nr:outer membrane protein OmpK [Ferrimonas futtsuensis]